MLNTNLKESSNIKNLLLKKDWISLESYLKNIPDENYRSWEYLIKAILENEKYKNIENSKIYIEKAYKLSKDNVFILVNYANILLKIKEIDKALYFIQESLLIEANNCMANLVYARILLKKEKYDSAFNAVKVAYKNISSEEPIIKEEINLLLRKLSPIWKEPLKGNKITLSRISLKHKQFLLKARRNEKFQHGYNIYTSDSEEILNKDIKLAQKPSLEIMKIEWVIEKNNEPIGLAGLVNIDMINRCAVVMVGFPGEKYSKDTIETSLLVLEFAFCKIKLHKLVTFIYSDNEIAQKTCLNLGFEQEGYLRSQILDIKSNMRLDLYTNGLLASDFFNNKKLTKLAERLLGRNFKNKKFNYSKLSIKKEENLFV